MLLSKFIKKILIFLLIAILTYCLFVILWGFFAPEVLTGNLNQPTNGYLYQRIIEVRKTKNVDILFLGASTSYRGFDTRIFKKAGYKTFNLGSSAQTPEQTKILLSRHLEKLNPKFVVYEVFPGILEMDGVGSSIDLIANTRIDTAISSLIWEHPNLKLINALIFNYFTQNSPFSNPYLDEKEKGDNYIKGGFVEHVPAINTNIKIKSARKWNILNPQLKAFEQNIQLLKNKKIPFLLVRAPLTSYKYNSYTNNSYLDSLYRSKGDFINFQKKVKLSDTLDFLDHTHLNQQGVEKLDLVLIKYLKNNYNIK